MGAVHYDWDPEFDYVCADFSDAGIDNASYSQEPVRFGHVISQNNGSITSFQHYDAIGTTRAISSIAQTVVGEVIYTANGELRNASGATPTFGFVGQVGYRSHASLATIYVRARDYSAITARWMSADPLGIDSRNANVYKYCDNSSVMLNDPSGQIIGPVFTICGAISCVTALNILHSLVGICKLRLPLPPAPEPPNFWPNCLRVEFGRLPGHQQAAILGLATWCGIRMARFWTQADGWAGR